MNNFKTGAKKLALIGLFVALLVISSVVAKIPMFPVPMTLQTAVILTSALLIGGAETFIVVAVYVFMGLIGIPVFAGNASGITYVLNPTFGFIIGFAFGGLFTGLIAGKQKKPSYLRLIIAVGVGTVTFYVFGIVYYIGLCLFYTGNAIHFGNILWTFWILFIPSDVLKGAFAVIMGRKVRPLAYAVTARVAYSGNVKAEETVDADESAVTEDSENVDKE